MVNVSPSGSLSIPLPLSVPITSIVTGVFKVEAATSSVAVGARLVNVIFTCASSVPPFPSSIV